MLFAMINLGSILVIVFALGPVRTAIRRSPPSLHTAYIIGIGGGILRLKITQRVHILRGFVLCRIRFLYFKLR